MGLLISAHPAIRRSAHAFFNGPLGVATLVDVRCTDAGGLAAKCCVVIVPIGPFGNKFVGKSCVGCKCLTTRGPWGGTPWFGSGSSGIDGGITAPLSSFVYFE